jgi:glycosyltransferase involved in cell wall biosynthesis
MSRTAGQPKADCLSGFPGVDLTVLSPDRMKAYGTWRMAESPEMWGYRYVVGGTRWRSVCNQWYLQHYRDAIPMLLREIRPDVIDIWEEPWSLTCAQAVWWAKRICPEAKIVVETEQNIYRRLPPPFQQFQEFSLNECDFAVARSCEALEVLRKKGYCGRAGVVPNAVDCVVFYPMAIGIKAILRAEIDWGPDDFVMGCVGRLAPEKGLADALAALPLLPARARMVFIGDGPCRRDLETLAAELNVANRVRFIEAVPMEQLARYMNAIDALILPSRTTPTWKEQFGRVIIEAGACGVATIGSDSGAIPDVIGGGGLTFPEGDVKALASRVTAFMEDVSLRARCESAALSQARELYSWRTVARRMYDIYHDILDTRAEPVRDGGIMTGALSR